SIVISAPWHAVCSRKGRRPSRWPRSLGSMSPPFTDWVAQMLRKGDGAHGLSRFSVPLFSKTLSPRQECTLYGLPLCSRRVMESVRMLPRCGLFGSGFPLTKCELRQEGRRIAHRETDHHRGQDRRHKTEDAHQGKAAQPEQQATQRCSPKHAQLVAQREQP